MDPYSVRPDLLEKTIKRLMFAMDLLLQADSKGDPMLARALADIVNWQMRETFTKPEGEKPKGTIRPFTYNYWSSWARGSKKEKILYTDRVAREILIEYWMGYRLTFGKKRDNSKKLVLILGNMFDSAVNARNSALNDNVKDPKFREKNRQFKLRTKPILESGKPVTPVRDNLQIDKRELENYKTEDIKCLLSESERMLSVISFKHQAGESEHLELYKELYQKWVIAIFDYYHSKKGVEKLSILVNPTLDYTKMRDILLEYNLFGDLNSTYTKPEGPYTKVKDSDFFVTKYLLWRLAQGLYSAYNRVNWKIDKEDKLLLLATIMQVFCVLCEEASNFYEHIKIVKGYQASRDKVKYMLTLNIRQKDILNTFNIITLNMYRRPHIRIVDRMEKYESSSEEEDCCTCDKKECSQKPENEIEKEKSKNSSEIAVKRKDGYFEVKNRKDVVDVFYEKIEEDAKKRECSSFSKRSYRPTDREEEEFEEVVKNFGQMDSRMMDSDIYTEEYKEDFAEGLKSVLKHYLSPPEKPQ